MFIYNINVLHSIASLTHSSPNIDEYQLLNLSLPNRGISTNGLLNETRLQGLGEGWERTLETSLLRSPFCRNSRIRNFTFSLNN